MKYRLVGICALALVGCGSDGSSEHAQSALEQTTLDSSSSRSSSVPSEPAPEDRTLYVAVLMGAHSKSRLYIQGSDIWWLHIDGVVPGLSGSHRGSVRLNDNYWRPEWPEDGDNPFCLCESSREPLPLSGFAENIVVEGISGGSVSILQQALNSASMETILEIANSSTDDGWVNFTIVPASEVDENAQDSITETTPVDDLETPKIDVAAKDAFESRRALDERFDNIISENVALTSDGQPSDIKIPGFVPRNAWVTEFAKLLPKEVCSSASLFTECYELNEFQCEWVLGNETKRCINQYYDQMPTTFIQPNDGGIWGETIGGCAGDAYAFLLSDWKLSSCDAQAVSPSEFMEKISGSIQVTQEIINP